MSDPSPRTLLPHVSQHQATASVGQERREQQKHYVFVDEQNRHRRLKVVRACDGCRKRKIKCDSANTNSWPCSACIRLKMQCIPPALNYDGEEAPESDAASSQSGLAMRFVPDRYGEAAQYGYGMPQYAAAFPYGTPMHSQAQMQPFHQIRNPPPLATTAAFPPSQQAPRYNPLGPALVDDTSPQHLGPSQNYTISSAPISAEDGAVKAEPDHLINGFVDLNITNDAVAKYMVGSQGEGAGLSGQDDQIALPPNVGPKRIPPEWMPSDNQAKQYFQYFFDHIHPYVPVVSRANLYRLWESDRDSISPLVLEAIFACSALAMQQYTEGNKWLALAARHEDSFKDSPRLSTIQGMLILLKAREAVHKRGYYYRSWLTIVHLVAMAKDLELDQHLEIHQMGEECGSASPDECVAKTRVWHVLFAVELIVGGPQGRTNYGVSIDTIDFDGLTPLPGIDDRELRTSQHFTWFLRCVRNVRTSNLLYTKLRRLKVDWASDPEFVRHNHDFDEWIGALPQPLHITYPQGGAAPYISFHFVANLHAYHNLSILVHYRPQLELASRTMSSVWKHVMMQCLMAAKSICRLQEGILARFGLAGLLHMLRGINFHIYAILTSINIHLVALTSPDIDVHQDAPDYFTRHMRLLENCSSSWPMPELQQQIESLRQAFSADLNKPFELKPSYVYGSPKRTDSMSPPPTDAGYNPHEHDGSSLNTGYGAFGLTSSSASEPGPRIDYSTGHGIMMMGPNQGQFDPSSQRPPQWDPSRIFDQWHAAFGVPQVAQLAQTPPSQPTSSPAMSYGAHPAENSYANYAQPVTDMSDFVTQVHGQQQQAPLTSAYVLPPHAYITPNMWREAVASASSAGIRRRWPSGAPGSSSAISKRPR